MNFLADEPINEIEAAAPDAIQTKSEREGTVNFVSIDYEHIQSELGALPEEDDAHLAEFFAGFEKISVPSRDWSSVNISESIEE